MGPAGAGGRGTSLKRILGRTSALALGASALALGAAMLAGCGKEESAGPDLSEPRAAALAFVRALEANDAPAARAAAIAGGIEIELVDAMAELSSASKLLRDTAVRKWGPQSLAILSPGTAPRSAQVSETLVGADVSLDGELATVRPTEGRSIQLKRGADALWRVDVGALTRGQDVSQAIPLFRALGSAAREVAAEIAASKLDSADAARLALERHLHRKMLPPTPATIPATTTTASRP